MFLIRLVFKLALLLIPILLLGAPVFVLLAGVQSLPLVLEGGSMRHEDVGRIKAMLKQHDPRTLQDGEVRPLTVNQRDLDLMLNTALPQLGQQRAAVDLNPGAANIKYTLALPENPLGKYLNLSALLSQQDDQLEIHRLGVGGSSVPGWAINPVIAAADFVLKGQFEEYRGMRAALKELQLQQDQVYVVYQWNAELAEQIQDRGRDLLLPEADRERIIAYYGEVSRLSHERGGSHSLAVLLQPLFALALERSESSGSPQAENRALFLTLGVVVQGSSIERLVGDRGDLPPRTSGNMGLSLGQRGDPAETRKCSARSPRTSGNMGLSLGQRGDLAEHFLVSAAITAGGGVGLADAAGVFKEISDSRGGSGFSFPDLLADRAGVVLAETAMGSPAAEVQRFMAANTQELAFMPSWSRLPEGMQEMEFTSRYEHLDSASYARVKDEIERRIAACAVYQ